MKKNSSVPTRDQLLAFIRESKTQIDKREIAKAFGVRGADKIKLKALLKDLALSGDVEKGDKKRVGVGVLAPVTVIDITHTDKDGDMFAKPAEWKSDAAPPKILVILPKKSGFRKGRERPLTVGVGDRVLARIAPAGDDTYEARPMKRLAAAPQSMIGVFEVSKDGSGYLRPVDKRIRETVAINAKDTLGAKQGDLLAVQVTDQPRHGPMRAKVTERLGRIDAPKHLSLIAIHAHGLPHVFSDEAQAQAKNAKGAPLGDRVDLRNIPLVTIDGEDARDFDDAVFAEPDTDPKNPGGWHILVAIADVAWYVRTGDALDRDAYARGNSVYFPDRVVPMLPEELSNGWCSLKPHEERPCLCAHMWLDAHGKVIRHQIIRGLMRSAARLTYDQVQKAKDGHTDEITGPLMKDVIEPLYGAYHALDEARAKRGTLELDITERKIIVDGDGHITGVVPRARYASHKLIEEFMIAANVAAAETLADSAYPAVYRIHDRPDPERVDALREALGTLNIAVAKADALKPQDFNKILGQVRETPNENLVNTLVLRTQSQALYSKDNIGHFGLGLRKYAHFTSPIRRYSDLLVHRALIAAKKLGEGGWSANHDPNLDPITEHISTTERRAAMAERQTVDRFTAAFLSTKTGAVFRGRISGVSRFGVFVNLEATGADGILPMRGLPQDFYDLDERNHLIVGRRSGLTLRTGDIIDVRLRETNDVAGSIVFEFVERADKMKRPGEDDRNGAVKGGGGGQPFRPNSKGRFKGHPRKHRRK